MFNPTSFSSSSLRETQKTFLAVLAIGVLLMRTFFLQPRFELGIPNNLLEEEEAGPVEEYDNNVYPSITFNSLAGGGSSEVTCQDVQDHVSKGEWEDPNGGKIFIRRVITDPPFYVSVHNEGYDPVRWKYLFETGDYYEKEVRTRFEYILWEYHHSLHRNDEDNMPTTRAIPIVLDVGGNIGYYTLLSSAWGHYVITFEINPSNLIRLCESIQYNGFHDRVILHRIGMSNTTGNLLGITVDWNPGATGLEQQNNNPPMPNHLETNETIARAHQFTVTTMTLDDFISDRPGGGWYDRKDDFVINLWKLDTEGHEGQILQGSKDLIQSRIVRNILIEFRPNVREATDLLLDAGYVIVDDRLSSSTTTTKNRTRTLLTKEDSSQFLDHEAIRVVQKRNFQYADLWFRLAELPFSIP